jgi:hypothetical protein
MKRPLPNGFGKSQMLLNIPSKHMLHKRENPCNVIVMLIYSGGDEKYLKLLLMMTIYYDVFEH